MPFGSASCYKFQNPFSLLLLQKDQQSFLVCTKEVQNYFEHDCLGASSGPMEAVDKIGQKMHVSQRKTVTVKWSLLWVSMAFRNV